jgi:hypothetical protein
VATGTRGMGEVKPGLDLGAICEGFPCGIHSAINHRETGGRVLEPLPKEYDGGAVRHRFMQLSKYCKRLVDTKQMRTRQFIKGLRQELR